MQVKNQIMEHLAKMPGWIGGEWADTLRAMLSNDPENSDQLVSHDIGQQDQSEWFGCTKVQRHFRLSYNDAKRLLDFLVTVGILEQDEYRVRFKTPVQPEPDYRSVANQLLQSLKNCSVYIESIHGDPDDLTERTLIEDANQLIANFEGVVSNG